MDSLSYWPDGNWSGSREFESDSVSCWSRDYWKRTILLHIPYHLITSIIRTTLSAKDKTAAPQVSQRFHSIFRPPLYNSHLVESWGMTTTVKLHMLIWFARLEVALDHWQNLLLLFSPAALDQSVCTINTYEVSPGEKAHCTNPPTPTLPLPLCLSLANKTS